MKRLVVLVTILALCMLIVSVAYGGESVNAYVTSNQLSVRTLPDSNTTKYTTIKNGDMMRVIGETVGNRGESFYIIELSSLDKNISDYDERGNRRVGYVMKDFVTVSQKEYVNLPNDTKLWAAPGSSVGVRQRSGKVLLLDRYIDAYGRMWYVVQANDDVGGAGFYLPSQQSSYQQQYPQQSQSGGYRAMVGCDTLGVRANQDDNSDPIDYLHYGNIIRVISAGGYFTTIEYTYNGHNVIGYVHTYFKLDGRDQPTLIKVSE